MRKVRGRSLGIKAIVTSGVGALLLGMAAVPTQAADTVRGKEWHLDAMEAEQIWKISTGRGVTVAVLDSGVDKSVPDLQGQVLPGKDFSMQKGDEYTDVDNHGTGIAALIAGTGRRGPIQGSWGLAPGAKIIPVRIPYAIENGAKDGKSFPEGMAEAIRYAADSPAKIINISVGDPYGNGAQLDSAVKYALGKGKLLFASVGNSGDKGNPVEYPAATPGVVGVGGLDKDAKLWSGSETGPQVDISAPATNIWSACTGGSEICEGTGTSPATALASASAALLWSKHPDWTNNQILRVLLNTASGPITGPRHNEQIGYGAVRPLVALKNPGDPGPADVYPLPDLAASEKKSGGPSASASAGAPAAGGSDSGKQSPAATAASDSGSGGSTGLWIGIGAAVVVVVAAVAAFAVSRVRRKARAAGAPPQQPPYAYTTAPQPYYPPQDQGYPQQQPPQYPGQYPPPPSGGQSGPPAGGA